MGTGPHGPISYSRAAHPLSLPQDQPYTLPSGMPPPVTERPMPGPLIGVAGHIGIGYQWAPGQGGATPGGGGAALPGGLTRAETQDWTIQGFVIPKTSSARHTPGTVGWVGTRRSEA